ncbi:hypothetical protein [Quadrisphaera setariae]|uniref:Uncharacterized protein n=1 Tax=Quadrisphaera setariae TaxID=2593304 RepID=A0A5C8Z2S5_9ACTN|nr:hypothetical protein [Quadrisphaera setariae]TXR51548.1 hypothetical protein FMM08_22345 [Quadrisphaera setariae]
MSAALCFSAIGMESAVAAPQPAASAQAIQGTSSTLASSSWKAIPKAERLPSSSPLSALNNYIEFSSTGYRITAPQSVLAKVPSLDLATLQKNIAATNAGISQQKQVMTSSAVAVDAPPLFESKVTTSGRHGYIKSHWYGYEIHLDAYLANKVIGGLWTGSGGAALIAVALGGGPAAGTVSVALATGAGAVQLCQASDNSVTIYLVTRGVYTLLCNPLS